MKFWHSLHQKCKKIDDSNNLLENLHYTVLGLGDTNYTNFCNFGKTVDIKLETLKAKRFEIFVFTLFYFIMIELDLIFFINVSNSLCKLKLVFVKHTGGKVFKILNLIVEKFWS